MGWGTAIATTCLCVDGGVCVCVRARTCIGVLVYCCHGNQLVLLFGHAEISGTFV